LSHSWHDDAEAKFRVMTQLAKQFHAANGRWPTLWLDKTCTVFFFSASVGTIVKWLENV